MLVCNIAVQCYECEASEKGCNDGPLADNDTISICPIDEPGFGCWVRRKRALSVRYCVKVLVSYKIYNKVFTKSRRTCAVGKLKMWR